MRMPLDTAPRVQRREREQNRLKPADVAERLNVPVTRVWAWIRAGWLEAEALPRGMYRIPPEAVDRFLNEKPWER